MATNKNNNAADLNRRLILASSMAKEQTLRVVAALNEGSVKPGPESRVVGAKS